MGFSILAQPTPRCNNFGCANEYAQLTFCPAAVTLEVMPKKNRNPKQYDIDPALVQLVKELAKELRVTESQIVQLFIALGLAEVPEGNSEIWNRLVPSKSLNYKYNIDISDIKKKLGLD